MRLENLKNEIPETPEFIHNMITNEVEKQMKKKRKMKWTVGKAAIVAAASCLAVSTISFAGAELYQMHLQKQGKYGTKIEIGDSNQGSNEKNQQLLTKKDEAQSKQIADVKLKANYVPNGMEMTEGKVSMNFTNQPDVGGITFDLYYLDTNGIGSSAEDKNVIESEKLNFGDHTGVYIKMHELERDGNFNQRIYIAYPKQERVLVMYVGDNVSKAEALKVAKGIQLEETGKKIASSKLSSWSEYNKDLAESGDKAILSVDAKKLKVYELGQKLNVTGLGEDKNGKSIDATMDTTVDQIQVADDFNLLDANKIPEEWKKEIGKDGKLIDNQLSYIKKGDGINSVDRVVKTKNVKQKLVVATVTYTNTSKKDLEHVLYSGNLTFLNKTNQKYHIYTYDTLSGEGYDSVKESSTAASKEMHYVSHKENYGNGGNYISIKAGEKIQVKMAWIVNETDLANMYLTLDGESTGYEFSNEMLKTGVVDIRQF